MDIKVKDRIIAERNRIAGDEYSFLDPYINSKNKMKVIHNFCGHQYEVTWNNFKSGKRCPRCSGRIKDEEFVARVESKVGKEYIFLEKYVTSRHKLKVKHNIPECGHEYLVTPNHFLKGRRCPKCWFSSRVKTNEEFTKEVYSLVGDEYEPRSKYISSREKVRIYHKTCGETYKVSPNEFLQGNRCPFCRRSKGEVKISQYLKRNNIPFTKEVSFEGFNGAYNVPYRYDFYLEIEPDNIILIEFDGKQHYEAIEYFGGKEGLRKRVNNDKIKDKYAAGNDIPLLRIPYWEYDNIETILDEKISKYIKH